MLIDRVQSGINEFNIALENGGTMMFAVYDNVELKTLCQSILFMMQKVLLMGKLLKMRHIPHLQLGN